MNLRRVTTTCGAVVLALFMVLLAPASPSLYAAELSTRYATVHYLDDHQLQRLNKELILGRRLSFLLDDRNFFTVKEEIAGKLDLLMDRVQVVLEMFPDERITFNIELYNNAQEAQDALYQRYQKQTEFISFYSRRDNLLYLSVRDAKLKVVAHELGHVVVEHYFKKSPPVKIHEVMAQYAEKHILD